VRPVAPARLHAARIATATGLATLIAAAVMLTDYAYPVFAKLLDITPMTSVSTTRPEVGVIVDAQPEAVAGLARQLSQHGMGASFALAAAPSAESLATLRRRGDDAIPRLDSGGMFHSFGTKGRLSHAAAALGLGKAFMYEPDSDFTLAQDWLAHAAGGSAVRGDVKLESNDRAGPLQRGDIVQVDLNQSAGDWSATLASLHRSLAQSGMSAVSVPELIDAGNR
jgi:hypothetical protein